MTRHRKSLLLVLGMALALVVAYVPNARAEPPGIEIATPTPGEVVSGVYNVTGYAADDVGVTNVEVRIDLGAWWNATDSSGNGTWYSWYSLWDTTAYADGWHDVWARAWDVEGNHSFDRVEVQVDNVHENTPPWVNIVIPGNEAHVCGTITVAGHSGDEDEGDAVELVQVRFRLGEWHDATPAGDNGSWSLWTWSMDTTLWDNGWGRLDARSWDGDAYSEIFDRWIKILNPCESDNHRPWVHIDHPSHGSTVSGIVVISGTAGDPDDFDKAELVQIKIGLGDWMDAVPLGPDGDPWRSWAKEWDTRDRDNGWVSICARSWDGELWSEPHCIEVFVHNGEGEHENHRPIVHITYPSNGQHVWGVITIRGTAEDPDEPGDAVEKVWVRIDGGDWVLAEDTSDDGSWHTWKRVWHTGEWENGEHTICARSWDGELYSETACIHVVVENDVDENQRPIVHITYPENNAEVEGTVTIRGTAEDDAGVEYVEWRIGEDGAWRDAFDTSDDGSWSTWKAYWHTQEFDDGCYVIFARAFDGHLYSELDHRTFCVDNVPDEPDHPPTVEITHPACGSEVSGTVVIEGVASDDHEVVKVQVRIDGGEWQDATPTGTDMDPWSTWAFEWHTQEWDNGEHHVSARALDNHGQYSDIDTCGYLVHNPPDGASPPRNPGVEGLLVPMGSLGLLGLLGAALVRRAWLGPIL